MTAPAGATPFEALADAVRQHLTVALNAETVEVARQSAERLWAELRAQETQAKAEMGGTTLDLSEGDDARKMRALLQVAAMALGANAGPLKCDGIEITHHDARAFRKRINAGVVRNCERRTGGAA